ncbi:allantoin permease [Klebsormidium nitens]|uniref:Allantoin permease n=1 Tax=Klebsormidium nitens TaxID=105231 RepID=A0A1Y1HUZ6_KLENI|nr:allantoin permease [Klebsormidium nitens]|eukprot:GAQ82450.1 allantoin permease [Klebsormidium nitens]
MPEGRIFSIWDLTSLWIGLVVAVPTYYLAGSLVEMGMSWWQGVVTVFCGNLLVLLPMILNGHPGTKYGIPFPVLSRASFGILGTNIPSLLRALVACGWFGIQSWVGGQAIYTLANACLGGKLAQPPTPWLGTSVPELASFFVFWSLQVAIIWNGIESIRDLEKYSAPVLILMCAALLAWAYTQAGGFGSMLSTPSQFVPGGPKEGQFWSAFFPSLTANVGFWATLSLNIPDFTRYAHSQRDQLTGQAIGLPLFMAAFTFVGLAVTSATVVIFGEAISDPIALLGRIEGVLPIALSLLGLTLATLTTNIAANVVAPANALVNLDPTRFSFRAGGLLTAVLGFVLAPWRLISSTQGFIFTWLIGYSALLGPVGGIVITDYFILRRRKLNVDALYTYGPDSEYWYRGGYNTAALTALAVGVLPNVPGFLQAAGFVASIPPIWRTVYNNAWVVGFTTAAVLYYFLMQSRGREPVVRLASG